MNPVLRAVVFLLPGLAACASLPEVPGPTRTPASGPRPFNICVPQVETPGGGGVSDDGLVYRPGLDAPAVTEELAGALAQTYEFVATPRIASREGEDEAERNQRFIDAAVKMQGDYLYTARVDRYEILYRGTNGWFWPATVATGQMLVPGWFIGDEDYRGELALTLTVDSVETRARLATERRVFRADVVASESTKGYTTLGMLFNYPGSLSDSNWARLEALVRPALQGQVRRWLAEEYEPPRLPPKSAAVIAGISTYKKRDQVPAVPAAAADGQAVYDYLLKRSGTPGAPAFLEQNIAFLPDGAAGRTQFLAALDKLAERSKPEDVALVYFAGRAALGPGPDGPTHYLLPWDADPFQPADTAIPARELRERLAKVRARSLVLVLDASFSSRSGDERAMNLLPDEGGTPPEFDPATILPEVPGAVCWIACGNRQGALDSGGKGLFTGLTLEGLAGSADRNSDGAVSWPELDAFVKRQMGAILAPHRLEQEPLLHGPGELPDDRDWLGLGSGELAAPAPPGKGSGS